MKKTVSFSFWYVESTGTKENVAYSNICERHYHTPTNPIFVFSFFASFIVVVVVVVIIRTNNVEIMILFSEFVFFYILEICICMYIRSRTKWDI